MSYPKKRIALFILTCAHNGEYIYKKSLVVVIIEDFLIGNQALQTNSLFQSEKLIIDIERKSNLIRSLLIHSAIKTIKGKGFMLSIDFENTDLNFKIIDTCVKNGLIVDWFLFNTHAMRLAPPLIINDEEIKKACSIILNAINSVLN